MCHGSVSVSTVALPLEQPLIAALEMYPTRSPDSLAKVRACSVPLRVTGHLTVPNTPENETLLQRMDSSSVLCLMFLADAVVATSSRVQAVARGSNLNRINLVSGKL